MRDRPVVGLMLDSLGGMCRAGDVGFPLLEQPARIADIERKSKTVKLKLMIAKARLENIGVPPGATSHHFEYYDRLRKFLNLVAYPCPETRLRFNRNYMT